MGDLGQNTNITVNASSTRYWVGGTGTWDDATNHWATSSGGAPAANRVPLP